MQRLERAPLDGEAVEDGVEIGWRAQRDLAVPERKRAVSAVVASAERHGAGIVLRLELRQSLGAWRRLREPFNRVHDAIEFECFQGSGVHGSRRPLPGRGAILKYI